MSRGRLDRPSLRRDLDILRGRRGEEEAGDPSDEAYQGRPKPLRPSTTSASELHTRGVYIMSPIKRNGGKSAASHRPFAIPELPKPSAFVFEAPEPGEADADSPERRLLNILMKRRQAGGGAELSSGATGDSEAEQAIGRATLDRSMLRSHSAPIGDDPGLSEPSVFSSHTWVSGTASPLTRSPSGLTRDLSRTLDG